MLNPKKYFEGFFCVIGFALICLGFLWPVVGVFCAYRLVTKIIEGHGFMNAVMSCVVWPIVFVFVIMSAMDMIAEGQPVADAILSSAGIPAALFAAYYVLKNLLGDILN